jgi:hypothetical protein
MGIGIVWGAKSESKIHGKKVEGDSIQNWRVTTESSAAEAGPRFLTMFHFEVISPAVTSFILSSPIVTTNQHHP